MQIMKPKHSPPSIVVVLATILSLGACQKKTVGTQAVTGQEVAHVGSEPITISELEFELRSLSRSALTDQDKVAALQHIAARKGLAQKAIAAGLDRQPGLLLEMRQAREQILANAAAISDVKSAAQKITLEQINTFISSHPFQFAKRQVLLVDELIVPSKNDIDKIVTAVKLAVALDQVKKYLSDNHIPFQEKQVELDTGSLPDVLSQALLKPNNIPVVRTPPLAVFMQVRQGKPAPVTGIEAERMAKDQMIRAIYETEMAKPSAGDDVSYMPPYRELIDKMKNSAAAR